MAKLKVRRDEKQKAITAGATMVTTKNLKLPGGYDAPQPWGAYYDPETGREHWHPTDPYSLELYQKRHGYCLGEAPPKLRAKWKRLQKKQQTEYEARMKAFVATRPTPENDRIAELEAKIERLEKLLMQD